MAARGAIYSATREPVRTGRPRHLWTIQEYVLVRARAKYWAIFIGPPRIMEKLGNGGSEIIPRKKSPARGGGDGQSNRSGTASFAVGSKLFYRARALCANDHIILVGQSAFRPRSRFLLEAIRENRATGSEGWVGRGNVKVEHWRKRPENERPGASPLFLSLPPPPRPPLPWLAGKLLAGSHTKRTA